MNKALIERQFSKSLKTYNTCATAQKQIIERFFELIENNLPKQFDDILEIGTGTGMTTAFIEKLLDYNNLYVNDFVSVMSNFERNFISSHPQTIVTLPGDIETIELNRPFNLIISTSTEQWIRQKDAFYNKIYNGLADGGYFAFTSFGQANLQEISEATGTKLNYLTFDDHKALLSQYFNILYVGEERIQLYFNSVREIMQHLKNTGVNGIEQHSWRKKEVLQLFEKIEKRTFVAENKYVLTYHPYYFILQKQ